MWDWEVGVQVAQDIPASLPHRAETSGWSSLGRGAHVWHHAHHLGRPGSLLVSALSAAPDLKPAAESPRVRGQGGRKSWSRPEDWDESMRNAWKRQACGESSGRFCLCMSAQHTVGALVAFATCLSLRFQVPRRTLLWILLSVARLLLSSLWSMAACGRFHGDREQLVFVCRERSRCVFHWQGLKGDLSVTG